MIHTSAGRGFGGGQRPRNPLGVRQVGGPEGCGASSRLPWRLPLLLLAGRSQQLCVAPRHHAGSGGPGPRANVPVAARRIRVGAGLSPGPGPNGTIISAIKKFRSTIESQHPHGTTRRHAGHPAAEPDARGGCPAASKKLSSPQPRRPEQPGYHQFTAISCRSSPPAPSVPYRFRQALARALPGGSGPCAGPAALAQDLGLS